MELVDTRLVQSLKLSAWATWGPPWGLEGYNWRIIQNMSNEAY